MRQDAFVIAVTILHLYWTFSF